MACLQAGDAPAPAEARRQRGPRLPEWIRDAFGRREWTATAAQRSLSLLGDGCLDLHVVDAEGRVTLELLQPGVVEPRTAQVPASGGELTTYEQLQLVGPSDFERWAARFSDRGAAPLLRTSLGMVPGASCIVRTFRPAIGGGGALAWITCKELVVPPA